MELRPITRHDARAWFAVRARNASWLQPWEATAPDRVVESRTFGAMVRDLRRQGREGRGFPWVLTYDDRLVGQVTVSGITWGSARWAQIGYWIDRDVAGRGIVPTGVALAVDHCFTVAGLHRVEINIRPENAPSLRVVSKLGFREEGLRVGFLHIDGAWRDHLGFSLCAEEVPGGVLARWHAARAGTAAERTERTER